MPWLWRLTSLSHSEPDGSRTEPAPSGLSLLCQLTEGRGTPRVGEGGQEGGQATGEECHTEKGDTKRGRDRENETDIRVSETQEWKREIGRAHV